MARRVAYPYDLGMIRNIGEALGIELRAAGPPMGTAGGESENKSGSRWIVSVAKIVALGWVPWSARGDGVSFPVNDDAVAAAAENASEGDRGDGGGGVVVVWPPPEYYKHKNRSCADSDSDEYDDDDDETSFDVERRAASTADAVTGEGNEAEPLNEQKNRSQWQRRRLVRRGSEGYLVREVSEAEREQLVADAMLVASRRAVGIDGAEDYPNDEGIDVVDGDDDDDDDEALATVQERYKKQS